jgi:uncharacterized protein (TIGR02145 family)
MKKQLLLMLLLVTAFQSFAQTKGISYQAVILNPEAEQLEGDNAQENILANSAVSLEFTFVDASGTAEYQEQHSTKTDSYGMINLLIGSGRAQGSNDFAGILWDGTVKKLKVGIDFSGGSNFSTLSEQDLTYMPQPLTKESIQLIAANTALVYIERQRAEKAEQTNAANITLVKANVSFMADKISSISSVTAKGGGNPFEERLTINEEIILSLEEEQATQNIAIALNTIKVSYPGDQDISGISRNADAISTIESDQTTQNTAIVSNTSKTGITAQQASDINANNAKVSYSGDQDISGISSNSGAISTIESEQTTQNTAIALNTSKISYPGDQNIEGILTNAAAISNLEAEQSTQNTTISSNTSKTGITTQQANDINANNAKVSYPGDQDISGISSNSGVISTIESEQTTQNTAIALNTSKTSYPGDQNISGILTNASAISTIESEQTTQNTAIVSNTAKTGITAQQASDINANNTKVSYPGDQDISGISTNAGAISNLEAEQSTQNTTISSNTSKTGISTQQANDINANNAKVSYPGDQNILGIAINTEAIANEVITAREAELALISNLAIESSRATTAENLLTSNLADEVINRSNADLLKEALVNKSTDVISDGASDTKYPSVKAIKTYVDVGSGASLVAVDDEAARALAAEGVLASQIADLRGQISALLSPVTPLASVTIDTQIWQNANLDVTTYRDGTPIPQVTDQNAWGNLKTGAWCYYNNDANNGTTYGKLYNWYAVMGIVAAESATPTTAELLARKKLAPTGWHVPTDGEWTTVVTFLGGETVAGGKMKEAGTTHWDSPNTDATNSSGFAGLPGGWCTTNNLEFGQYGFWWSSTLENSQGDPSFPRNPWSRGLDYNNGRVYRDYYPKTTGFSVRCLRD